jgi:hypothetical protein
MIEMSGWLCLMYEKLNVFAVHASAGKSDCIPRGGIC